MYRNFRVTILGQQRVGLKPFILNAETGKPLKIVALTNKGYKHEWLNVQRIEWDFGGEVVYIETLDTIDKIDFKWNYEKVSITYSTKKDLQIRK